MELQERARRLLRALDATLGSAKGVDGCPLGMEQQENAQQGMEEDLPLFGVFSCVCFLLIYMVC